MLIQAAPDVATQAIDALHDAAKAASGNVLGSATTIFAYLAAIGFGWDASLLALERADIAMWAGGILRRLIWVATFLLLLMYGPQWTSWIVESFQMLGQNASGVASVSPGDILATGADVSGTLLSGSGKYGFLHGEFTVGFMLVIAAVGTRVAFVLIAVQVAILLALWYVVGTIGVIFLGFGGSRWTAQYTERYYSMAVSIGIKFLCMMFVTGIAVQFAPLMLKMAQAAPSANNPGGVALEVLTAAGLLALICWQVPKIFSTLMGASPTMGAGELWAGISALVSGAMAATGAAMVAGGIVSSVGGSIASKLGGGSSGAGSAAAEVSSVTSAGSSRVSPSNGSSSGSSNGAGPAGGWTGPGSEAWASAQNGAGSSGAAGGGGAESSVAADSEAPAAPTSAGGSSGRGRFAGVGYRARQAGEHGLRAMRTLSDDGGGHAPGPPSINIGG